MSKAFTKEEADAEPIAPARTGRPPHVRVSAWGARLAREKMESLAARQARAGAAPERAVLDLERERFTVLAESPVAPVPTHLDVVGFGAAVRVRAAGGRERTVVIVSADEVGLVPHGASATSPIAVALVGARVGDVVEIEGPGDAEELTVLDVQFPQ